ncbi:homeobox domain-containing protein [Endozoicomonas sp. YOMI1]|uniref:homeobox domain-containing protein n=1 Tax=Endozoicomonas sp. YOMI1 TaxID=2828739 RepID=UPI0021486467
MGRKSCQPAAFEMIKSKADTSELHSRQSRRGYKVRKIPQKRTIFDDWKIQELNNTFQRTKYLTRTDKSALASRLQMTEVQVKIWFQNKRANTKRLASLARASLSAQSKGASKAISQTLSTKQQMSSVSRQEVVAQQRYALFCESDVISLTKAQSPAAALQEMLVNFKGAPQVPSSCSIADYGQSGSPEPEPPTTPTGELNDDDESDSSLKIDL